MKSIAAIILGCFAVMLPTLASAKPPDASPGQLKKGVPGTITVVRFAGDGKTIISTRKFKAHDSDSSGSVTKDGDITSYDDEGRPDNPKRYNEAVLTPGQKKRMDRQMQAVKKRAECCSPDGCAWVDATREVWGAMGWLFDWDWIGTLHHSVYWCWDYPTITDYDAGCWSDLAWSTNSDGCGGFGWFYHWAGSNRGGHYSFRQGNWNASVVFFVNYNPWVEVWINGNGAWASDQGGS